jgi:hypothetical protein
MSLDLREYTDHITNKAKKASSQIRSLRTKIKNNILHELAEALINESNAIIEKNKIDVEEGKKKGYIKYKIPNDYKRNFFVYRQDTDIDNNPVVKKELFEGSQKRFIYWVKQVQK